MCLECGARFELEPDLELNAGELEELKRRVLEELGCPTCWGAVDVLPEPSSST